VREAAEEEEEEEDGVSVERGGEEGIGEIRTIHANVGPILLNDHTAHKILTR
jgi:hypothetical protein